jgi:hypothetical protein
MVIGGIARRSVQENLGRSVAGTNVVAVFVPNFVRQRAPNVVGNDRLLL